MAADRPDPVPPRIGQPAPEPVDGELRYACPCCGYRTLTEPTPSDEICHVCFWQDDLVDNLDTDVTGPNRVTLSQARANFRRFGAHEQRWVSHVRPPRAQEGPPSPWTAPPQ
jgi:hypothetical protein